MKSKVLLSRLAVMALVLTVSVQLASAQSPPISPLAAALEAAEKAALEKSAADRVLTQKNVAIRSAQSTAEAVATALKKAQEAKLDAERIGAAEAKAVAEKSVMDLEAQAKTFKAAVESATKELTAASKVVQEKTAALNEANAKLNKEKTPLTKAATDASKVAFDATTMREKVAGELNKKTGVANQAATTAAASQAAVAKLEAEKAAATKTLADKTTAAKAAADALAASLTAGAKSQEEKVAAEKAATTAKTPQEKEAASKVIAAKNAAVQAVATKISAAKAALDKVNAEKATIEASLANNANALKTATAKATTDKAAADKAAAEKVAAEKELAARNVAERSAHHKAAAARAIAEGGLPIIPESAWTYAKARHLLVRAGFGGTPDEVKKLHDMGLVEAVNYLLDYQYHHPDDKDAFHVEPPERPLPNENLLTPQERERLNNRRENKRNSDYYRLRNWWAKRLTESPRALQEKMVLFWHGHFVSEWQKVAWAHLLYQQNQLFRDHATGNFGGLLFGIVHDPCMIVYLDNQINYKGRPNQNLARELMELFSMGVNNGYTEFDIREGARTLTGYTYEHYTGQFRFNQAQHDTDLKTLFGETGPWTGDDFCTLILKQPHTARFMAAKIFEYFTYNDPDPKVVAQLATVFRGNGYEISALLRNIFMSEEFYSPKAVATQIKSPIQLFVGLLRDFGVKGADYNYVFAACTDMGQELFQPPNVKGWYGGRDWINANLIFTRYNHTANLIRSVPQSGKAGIDLVAFLENKGCTTAEQVVDYLAKACLVTPLNAEQRKELTAYLGQLPPPAEWAKQKDQLNNRFRQVLVLLMSTPEAQIS